MLMPPNRPTPMQMMNMIPDRDRIADKRATSRKCDQPGVVSEKDNWKLNEPMNDIELIMTNDIAQRKVKQYLTLLKANRTKKGQ